MDEQYKKTEDQGETRSAPEKEEPRCKYCGEVGGEHDPDCPVAKRSSR
jgi:hypothetical protein